MFRVSYNFLEQTIFIRMFLSQNKNHRFAKRRAKRKSEKKGRKREQNTGRKKERKGAKKKPNLQREGRVKKKLLVVQKRKEKIAKNEKLQKKK